MPIYEYICKNCNHKFETMQKVSEVELLQCPHCHKDTLRKQISLSTFRLYGDGFHKPNER